MMRLDVLKGRQLVAQFAYGRAPSYYGPAG